MSYFLERPQIQSSKRYGWNESYQTSMTQYIRYDTLNKHNSKSIDRNLFDNKELIVKGLKNLYLLIGKKV